MLYTERLFLGPLALTSEDCSCSWSWPWWPHPRGSWCLGRDCGGHESQGTWGIDSSFFTACSSFSIFYCRKGGSALIKCMVNSLIPLLLILGTFQACVRGSGRKVIDLSRSFLPTRKLSLWQSSPLGEGELSRGIAGVQVKTRQRRLDDSFWLAGNFMCSTALGLLS